MKTLITLLTFVVFVVILIKKKVSSLKSVNRTENKALPSSSSALPVFPAFNIEYCDVYSRHDVYIFDFSGSESVSNLADVIEAKLSIIEAEMREKEYPYFLRWLVLNNYLACIVEYRIKSIPSA